MSRQACVFFARTGSCESRCDFSHDINDVLTFLRQDVAYAYSKAFQNNPRETNFTKVVEEIMDVEEKSTQGIKRKADEALGSIATTSVSSKIPKKSLASNTKSEKKSQNSKKKMEEKEKTESSKKVNEKKPENPKTETSASKVSHKKANSKPKKQDPEKSKGEEEKNKKHKREKKDKNEKKNEKNEKKKDKSEKKDITNKARPPTRRIKNKADYFYQMNKHLFPGEKAEDAKKKCEELRLSLGLEEAKKFDKEYAEYKKDWHAQTEALKHSQK